MKIGEAIENAAAYLESLRMPGGDKKVIHDDLALQAVAVRLHLVLERLKDKHPKVAEEELGE
jgi:hypothetical protein